MPLRLCFRVKRVDWTQPYCTAFHPSVNKRRWRRSYPYGQPVIYINLMRPTLYSPKDVTKWQYNSCHMGMAENPTPERVQQAQNIWLATVRPDGRPHLVAIWFVTAGGHWYICTAPGSVKARNMRANPWVTLALEDGNDPYVVEGQAHPVEPDAGVVAQFKAKYDWDISTDEHYSQVFEIRATRLRGSG
jgi:F420H(2)-dependent biliverdin reductase